MVREAKRRKALAAKRLGFGMHYLAILEWLEPKDQKTGSELADKLSKLAPQLPVTCTVCDSAAELLASLEQMVEHVRKTGLVPLLQIDAHGYKEGSGQGLERKGSDGATERISWDALAAILRRLNIATGFNLVFVGAACWSDNAIYSVTNNGFQPLPFLIAVGFPERVDERHLFAAMLCLHNALLVEKVGVQESLDRTQALMDLVGVKLAWFSIPKIVRNAVVDALGKFADPAQNESMYRRALDDAEARKLNPPSRQDFDRQYAKLGEASVALMLREMLAYDLLPENEQRFGFDPQRLAREAKRNK